MKAINIFTEPFRLTDITECRIEKTVNEHFQTQITGYISQAEEETYLDRMLEITFIVKAKTEEQEEISLFRGCISDVLIYKEDGMTRITVCAKSKTMLLDIGRHTRTYQGEDQTYRQIVDDILSYHEHTALIQPKGKNNGTRGLVVQYEETDWQFLKRLASQLNFPLVPDCTNDHICLFFGNPERRGEDRAELTEYRMRRYVDYVGRESVEYLIKTRQIYQLCKLIYIKNTPCFVYHVKGEMERQELQFEYTLRPGAGFGVPEIVNEKLRGISVMGEVDDVRDTRVRVRLFSENDCDFRNPIWFSFSTVYSSPDGTGWYCMPEKGDHVRLHIPGNREEDAYVISAVHLENEHGFRENPDEKIIRTKFQKEIRLTPDKIVITNHKGISLTMDDREGITIRSSSKINIISENEIEIKGEQIQMEGQKGVILMEGPNVLMVRDGIKEYGINIEHR